MARDEELGLNGSGSEDESIRAIPHPPPAEISEIKLKRTDTTLDLSQKAKRAKEEKRKSVGAAVNIPLPSAG
ncbi:MAG: hypothetical protein L6R36_008924 [Xanthoria steineri]|nr:MAG: hypothetical protein L6R36_008924 [Xanthoria steineri]